MTEEKGTSMSYDYSDFTGTGADLLQAISDAGDQIIAAEAEVAEAEAVLKRATTKLRQLTDVVVPELMERASMEEFKLKDGRKVKIDEQVRASLAQERAPEGIEWLREHGHGGAVKTQVVTEFGMGTDEEALGFYEKTKTLTNRGMTTFKSTVHSSTLASLMKTLLQEGALDDKAIDLFKVTRMRVAKIK